MGLLLLVTEEVVSVCSAFGELMPTAEAYLAFRTCFVLCLYEFEFGFDFLNSAVYVIV